MNRKYLVRQGAGPLLTPDQMPCEANAVLNPGVAELDGEVILLDVSGFWRDQICQVQ